MSRIIGSVYGRRYHLHEIEVAPGPGYVDRLRSAVVMARLPLLRWSAILMVLVVVIGSIYYYNQLITTEQDVRAAQGKVHSLLQRRNDISINLSQAVLDYSKHEQGVFTAVVALRAAASVDGNLPPEVAENIEQLIRSTGMTLPATSSGSAAPNDAMALLTQLRAVAEQYPDLKLSNTFLNLMTALIEVEKDLALQRIDYNDKVNTYTTTLAKFPTNVYGAIFRFKPLPYFEATPDAQQLQRIRY